MLYYKLCDIIYGGGDHKTAFLALYNLCTTPVWIFVLFSGAAVEVLQASVHRDNGDAYDGCPDAVQLRWLNDLERPSWLHSAGWQRPSQTTADARRQQDSSDPGPRLQQLYLWDTVSKEEEDFA